jgi:DNA-directed RNA polymerase specialized sigma24 family protein
MSLKYSIATRETLLLRLKGIDDHASWQDFFDIYWRLIYGVAVKAGLNEDEAQDVLQDTVATVAKNIPKFRYDPTKCAFKT